MEAGRAARLAPLIYIGTVLGAMALLAVALHVDVRGTIRSLQALFAAAVVFGLPLAVALAAFRREHAPLLGLLCCGLIASVLLTLAALSSSDLRESIVQAQVQWLAGAILISLSLLLALGLSAARGERSLLVTTFAPILILGIFVGFVLLARGFVPEFRVSMEEDGWAEWTTFYAFLTAGAANLWIAWGAVRGPQRVESTLQITGTLMACGAGLLCLLVAAEEISWGQRLVGFKPPGVFSELNYQQEMNVHNFFKGKHVWKIPLESKFLVVYLSVLYGFVLPFAAAIATWSSGKSTAARLPPSPYLAPCFGLVGLAELTYPLPMTGEAAELLLGVVFLVDAILRLPAQAAPLTLFTKARRLAAALALPLLAGIATPWLVAPLSARGSAAAVEQTREELVRLREDLLLPGALAGLLERDNVHRRLYTALSLKYVRFGEDSRFMDGTEPTDRRRYLLDPWNTAYWIRYKRGRPVLLVYSFGPNRRRDTDFRQLTEEDWGAALVEGDDLAIAVPLPADGD